MRTYEVATSHKKTSKTVDHVISRQIETGQAQQVKKPPKESLSIASPGPPNLSKAEKSRADYKWLVTKSAPRRERRGKAGCGVEAGGIGARGEGGK
ncbi:unnamed protein product [Pieris brassicae]|uniref:Uncharacterized protein n=1 Tax=Pieris brassicae TaxID=7116 RepID=A0A9P0THB9_PIEBR|nr:unnamed protein product [Pieris brassicae]